MQVRFTLRVQGHHEHHSTHDMEVVPREGETVRLDRETIGIVDQIEWNVPGKVVDILVRIH